MFKFELGDVLKDTVTGFSGVCLGRSEYLTGCSHYGLQRKELTKDGKIAEYEWLDETRLEKVKSKSAKKGRNGGPEQNPPSF